MANEQLVLPLPNTFVDDVTKAAAEAYHEVSSDQPEWPEGLEPHRARLCQWISHIMLNKLVREGYKPLQILRAGQKVNEHSYLSFRNGDLEVIADATWQQFAPRKRDDLPKILLGTREEVVSQALDAGVNEKYLDLWMPSQVDFVIDNRVYEDALTEDMKKVIMPRI